MTVWCGHWCKHFIWLGRDKSKEIILVYINMIMFLIPNFKYWTSHTTWISWLECFYDLVFHHTIIWRVVLWIIAHKSEKHKEMMFREYFVYQRLASRLENQNVFSMSMWDLYAFYYVFFEWPKKAGLTAELEVILAFERHTCNSWLVM